MFQLFKDDEVVFQHSKEEKCLYYGGHLMRLDPNVKLRLDKDWRYWFTEEDTKTACKHEWTVENGGNW